MGSIRGFVQEKNQVVELRRPKRDHEWVSDDSARVDKIPLERGSPMPPGMDIENQDQTLQHETPFSMSGETDVSRDYNEGAVRNGYTRKRMSPTDEMYTREHNPVFYDTIEVDGMEGFVERGNVLDRD